MTTITATNARKDLFTLLWNISKGQKSYKIKYKNDNIVLINEEDYSELMETLELLSENSFKSKLVKAEKEIIKWETYWYDDIFN